MHKEYPDAWIHIVAVEIISQMVLAVAIALIAATLLRNHMGFLASAIWTLFPVYGALLPVGTGLIVLTGGLMLTAVVVVVQSRQRFRIPAALIAAFVLVAFVNVRELLDPSELGGEGIRLLASVVAATFMGYVGYSVRWRQGFAWGLLPGGIILAVAEILRVASGGLIHAAEGAFGINPIVLGQYAAIAAVVAGFQILRGSWRWPMWTVFFVATGGVVATGSRGPLLGLVFAFLYLLLACRNGKSKSRVPRIVGVLYAVVLTGLFTVNLNIDLDSWLRIEDEDQNAGSRVDAWGGAWTTILQDGFVGAGPGRYFESGYGVTVGLPDYPHNLLLEIWSEYGFLTALVLVTVLVMAWRAAGPGGHAFVLFALIIASVSGALATSLVFWMAIALATSTLRVRAEREHDSDAGEGRKPGGIESTEESDRHRRRRY